MDSSVIVALISAVLVPTVASILSWLQSRKNTEKLKSVESKQTTAAHAINSRLDELLKTIAESERAKGRLEGIAEQKALGDSGNVK